MKSVTFIKYVDQLLDLGHSETTKSNFKNEEMSSWNLQRQCLKY